MKNIYYIDEHTSCVKYNTDPTLGFRHQEYKKGFLKESEILTNHTIIFVIKGKISLSWNNLKKGELEASQCILAPRSSSLTFEVVEDAGVVSLGFETLHTVCNKQLLQHLKIKYSSILHDFKPLTLHLPVINFINQLIYYLHSGFNCEHLHEIKEREFFILLRGYYDNEEIASLLHPLFNESDFKVQIMEIYKEVDSVTELSQMMGMSRTAFDYKFKEEFGTSARQWMLKQLARDVQMKAKEPGITITELMSQFKFNSATHFNRFCKQQFNCTPGELIRSFNDEE